jgi:beta-N-acetylhexosaminidase
MSPRSLRHEIGQLLMAGFDGPLPTPELKSIASEFSLGGVVLFGRNVEEPSQVAESAWASARLGGDLPGWVAVDQEGGRVARFRDGFTRWPAAATLGRSGDAALATRFARALGAELAALGVTLDYAPVLDVFTNADNTVIGDRALGTDADTVSRLGVIVIEELQKAGVAACGKHFPGHGDTFADSHHDLPAVEHDLDRLRRVEFLPFRAAINAGVASLMTCHVLVPAAGVDEPATLSQTVVSDWLREELGWSGLVFTDDMEMQAIAGRIPVPDAAVRAVAAGCDGVLVCSGNHDLQVATVEALIRAVESGVLPVRRVEDAIKHQRDAKERFAGARPGRPAPPSARELAAVVACERHQAIAAEMAQFT